ncbi:sodium-extruding oxaloacetate decarboxylase subunit alpha [Ectothiorhodospira lacustris]|uniref:sodium-extruding oxaloacetate decarboxylase subunit alpha n=1 Tax=Ectothiorhodospira lacustris TaxID=2899127 RepID=UPI001EE8B890|nr:sodium-extruding oxaloacetate decarboxylase subunit alpha [Ectothiorhodospira lacustris]MCG5509366.1 sodium-extruding oxaloacetate decarboxylase subunit alpha [Ectothiorhodospira lacustris]MCG5521420.1 sodium-extruding oxaloacetate decarboxylase subunit alpha [Ectothiorhodospira lacustris]
MSKVTITDLTLRDGHQSLIATRMRTEDMLPICDKLDAVGFWSLEVWGGATFDTCLRFLKEDPWERLRKLREALPNTQLQMLLRGQNLLGYRHYADDVVRDFVARCADNGMDVFRIFDAMNDTRNVQVSIEAVKKAGKHAQGAISYTTSPVHTLDQFVTMAREMVEMGCDSIAIKDMAGLLTPRAAGEITAALVDAVKVPVHLHTHATAGLSEMCHLKAIENGCSNINTAMSAFAGGTSHAPTESMVAALRDTEYDTGLDLNLLQEIGFYFHEIRKKYHQFESEYTGVDTRVQTTQVPGGMISNLISQLKAQGALDKVNAVMAEIPRVREDLGYPPLVTPTSQIVGTQAVMNVLTESRYKTITNEVKLYLQGRYGRTPGHVNSVVRQKAIGHADVIECRPADLLDDEMDALRNQIGELAQSEEDVLIYAMFPEIGREFLQQRRDGKLVPEPLEPLGGQGDEKNAPVEFKATLHGETYHIKLTGTGHKRDHMRPFYVTVDGMPEEIVIETLDEILVDGEGGARRGGGQGSGRPRATKPGHVTTSMPGTIIDVLVKEGDTVKPGDGVLILEAMKMETEVQAPVGGVVKAIHVAKGDSVNPDDALVEIEEA